MTGHRQRGTSLLEALVTFAVLSLGMLALARVQSFLRDSADLARQRSEAVRLAQQDLERLRGFATLLPTPGVVSYGDIADGDADVTPPASPTRYVLTRQVQSTPSFKAIKITLSWNDRSGAPQRVQLNSIIAAHDPVYSGALALSRR